VEFVSAKSTGPLLISHGRNAVLGDAVARLLEANRPPRQREYYINDFVTQIRLLAESWRSERRRASARGGYELAPTSGRARRLDRAARAGRLQQSRSLGPRRLCVSCMLDGLPGSSELPGIRRTLGYLGIAFDNWFSEESLYRGEG